MKMTYTQVKALQESTETFEQFLKAIEQTAWYDEEYRDDPLCRNLARSLLYQREQLLVAAERVKNTSEGVLRRMNPPKEHYEYCGVSSLGELQSNGVSFDIH